MDFSHEIIAWYHSHKRDLPWRNSSDPYIIWLSEIILQQTRVEQGMPYFYKFSEKYPTVSDFAMATEDEVLKLWQGLGYYSRGRNMHRTANLVMEEHAGYFPKTYNELIKLKGIGDYTASAISSFAGNEPNAVVDGNVFRLLARYYGIEEAINSTKGKKIFSDLASQLIDHSQPGLYNQAIMEFGSLQCRYKNPDCGICPLRINCDAYNTGKVAQLPVKLKTQKVRNRYFNYIIAVKDGKILMNKRGPNDIWENLHEFPLFETAEQTDPQQLINSEEFKNAFGEATTVSVYGPVKHILSHQKIQANFIQIENFEDHYAGNKDWFYANFEELELLAQPKLIFAFLKNLPNLKSDSLIF
jgi:A/G-specific adenine glycosylase